MSRLVVSGDAVGLPGRRQVPLPPLPTLCDIPGGPQVACETLADSAGDAAGSAIDQLIDSLVNGFGNLLRVAMSWWTTIRSPELTGAGGAPGSALSAVRDYTSGLQVIMLTCGLMFAAARLALAKRGGVAGEAQESFLMLARAVFGAMTFAAVVTAGTQAGDAFANWVLDDAAGPDRAGAVERILAFDEQTRVALGPGALLLLGLLGAISALVQLVMLVVRQALLVLVVAVIPLAAAASGTGPGSQSYKKLLAWTLAFVLWKPVGALVYAIAFTVIGNDASRDPHMVLLGLILLVMSVIVLPALIRLVAPAVSTLGGGGGAASVLAGGLAGVAMGAASGSKGGSAGGRKLSEGDNAAGGAGGGGGGGNPSPSGPPSGGGGGRAMPGTGSGSGGSGLGVSTGPTAEAATEGSGGGGAAKSSAAKAGAGSGGGEAAGKAGGAGAAGPIGVAVAAGEAVKAKVQQGSDALESAVDSGGAGAPDALGPGEVRR